MIYELFLVSVVLGAGYWGWYYVRRRPHGTATFGVMQLAIAALAALGLVGHRLGVGWLGILGAIGLGAGGCVLVIGPVARAVARRMVVSERMTLATRLLDLAELLAPGSGVAEEKALVRAMTEIRAGRIEPTVDALTAARERASDDARLVIDERIAMLYLAAYRWSDAIAHAEAHLFDAPPPHEVEGSLRRALGFAPPVWVDLLGAYGRIGDLEQAARMMARLEDVCAGRDDATLWIHRARMMFLALAGRIEAVRALVVPARSRHMTPAARTYWIAVAHQHRGDREAAALAFEKARARSRGRPRDLIDQALARLGDARRAELAAVASEVVARVEAAPLPPPIQLATPRGPRATWLVTAVLIAVSAVTGLAVGDTADLGVLVRAGAMVHGVVDAGEWWRLIACLFVHVGVVHLGFNVLGLFVLGRLAEDLFGSARMLAIFAVAGITGAVASYAAGASGISAGASGAVFGLLGAVFVEITWHRQRYRAAWKRGLWGGLAVVAVSQLGFGFFYTMIDQWAHGAGLAAGALLGAALSPYARWARAGTLIARAIAIGFAAAFALAAVLVVRTSLTDSLTRGGLVQRRFEGGAGVVVQAPVRWEAETSPPVRSGRVERTEHRLVQPDLLADVTIERMPSTAPYAKHEAWRDRQLAGFQKSIGEAFGPSGDGDPARRSSDSAGPSGDGARAQLAPATEPLIALPDGWTGEEQSGELPADDLGHHQRVRLVVCERTFGDQRIAVFIQVPETIATAGSEFFAQLLASIAPAS